MRVCSPGKTAAICSKFCLKIGFGVVLVAPRKGWCARKLTPEQLAASAQLCRVRRVIQPYLETLT